MPGDDGSDSYGAGNLPRIDVAQVNALGPAFDAPTSAWFFGDTLGNWTATSTYNWTPHLSFDTPVGVPSDKQCGRAVFSDLHVGAASGDYGGLNSLLPTVPDGCANNGLSPQEKALELMLFDLSSCLTPNDQPPQPPQPMPQ